MGACLSFEESVSTAKLMVEGAGLIEFIEPVKVSDILRERRQFFVCDSRSIALNDYLQPLRLHERLELNHLYFLLPLGKLQHRLTAFDIVVLAGNAGAAIKRSGYRHSRKVIPLADNNMNGHPFYELLSEELSHGKDSPEELIKSRNLAKGLSSVSAYKSKEGTSTQTSSRKTRTPILSPIAESPLHQSFESN